MRLATDSTVWLADRRVCVASQLLYSNWWPQGGSVRRASPRFGQDNIHTFACRSIDIVVSFPAWFAHSEHQPCGVRRGLVREPFICSQAGSQHGSAQRVPDIVARRCTASCPAVVVRVDPLHGPWMTNCCSVGASLVPPRQGVDVDHLASD